MRNERKLMYQQRKISELEAKIKNLTQENNSLLSENNMLHNMVDAMQLSVEDMKSTHDEAMKKLNSDIQEVNELKAKYAEVVSSADELKKEYKNKMSLLLKRMSKQRI